MNRSISRAFDAVLARPKPARTLSRTKSGSRRAVGWKPAGLAASAAAVTLPFALHYFSRGAATQVALPNNMEKCDDLGYRKVVAWSGVKEKRRSGALSNNITRCQPWEKYSNIAPSVSPKDESGEC